MRHTPVARTTPPCLSVLAAAVVSLPLCSFSIMAETAGEDTLALGAYSGMSSGYGEIPEVLTTTRLRQPKSRVPGTTSVISGDMIRALGILNLEEVFRLVPGMTVGAVGSNTPVVSYHGTVAYDQRRLQVQIDGRTAYQPSLAGVQWNTMPVAIENIDRIEVSRGPNAAAYGINAFLGTINIITRDPGDTAGVNLQAGAGANGYRQLFGSVSGTEEAYDWRLSLQQRRTDGFDEQVREIDGVDTNVPFNNGYELNFLNYDSALQLTNSQSLEFRAGITDGVDEEDRFKTSEDLGIQTQPDVDVRDYYLQTRWNYHTSTRHFLHVQASYQSYDRDQDWRSCNDITALGFPPIDGETVLCADLNHDLEESRLEFELQDTLLLNDDLKLVSGLEYREDKVTSDTYFNGDESNYQSQLFGNLEYTPIRWMTLNFGASWERTSTLDDNFFSPRIAANFQLSPNQTLRFVYSEAVRNPSAYEQSADWDYRVANGDPPTLDGERLVNGLLQPFGGFAAQGDGSLGEERIRSREISYFTQHRFDIGVFSTEIKYFNDDIRDVISGQLNILDWDLENNVALDQQGIELEAALDYRRGQLRATYAYMDQDERYTGTETTDPREQKRFLNYESRLTVRHSGSLAWLQRYARDYTSSVAFYFADEFRTGQFERLDLRVAKHFDRPGLNFDIALIIQHYLNDNPLLSPDNSYRNRNHVFVQAGMTF